MPSRFYDFHVDAIDGDSYALSRYEGKVVLVVNTASECGFTPQYDGLEKLYRTHHKEGFVVLGFPCNQFGRQEPGDESEIQSFCEKNYGVSFPMHKKVEVNGTKTHPLFAYLKKNLPGLLGSETVKWNFTKFLVDRQGVPHKRYAPATKPSVFDAELQKLL